jgi:hypothetical protein
MFFELVIIKPGRPGSVFRKLDTRFLIIHDPTAKWFINIFYAGALRFPPLSFIEMSYCFVFSRTGPKTLLSNLLAHDYIH